MTQVSSARGRLARFWRDYRSTVAFLFLMLMFRSAWADWMSVPTGSMNPTILEGDRILVDKHVFGLRLPWTLIRLTDGRDPQRGEIVVFDPPSDGPTLVKRVIGVPGDEVAIDARGLSINGQYANYSAGDVALVSTLLARTREHEPSVYREGGVLPEHALLRMPIASAREYFGPVRVPADMYLMLGDNRDNSADSRYIGFVPRRNIIGLTSRVAVSFNPENYYLPRSGRYLTRID
ncbi:MAG TPA: signal peptidase I [Steroidobacteraceae bacterium]|nr:signal peptidase I [Steroidobacteraceae bacterium]